MPGSHFTAVSSQGSAVYDVPWSKREDPALAPRGPGCTERWRAPPGSGEPLLRREHGSPRPALGYCEGTRPSPHPRECGEASQALPLTACQSGWPLPHPPRHLNRAEIMAGFTEHSPRHHALPHVTGDLELGVECSDKDLHSGVYGGSVHEAMTDLIALMGSLIDNRGNILIPGINEAVAPVTDEEHRLYDHIDFDLEEFAKDVGAKSLLHGCKKDILMHRWRYPSLSLHGIEGAFSGSGAKTVIPRKVVGKFSIRLVPDMTPEVVSKQVTSYLTKKFAELHSPNKFKVYMCHGGKPWVSDFNHPHYMAGRRALKTVFGVEPDLTREGGSIPVTLTFQEATGKNVMLLPVGSADDGAHSQNEKLNRHNYIEGTKMLASYLYEVSQLKD
ncbi:cytosolic non-specific dipeptidase isoform X2 [Sciurus carolinensis]|uniref:cytosolic non-specific dipeptidase isoform X2 n=1 Tax=Sciurus carolinensis TaxID=30640 RepID=UPI001FB29820|nr:cytosolic non-specific dipeptidase isoform X2 [Sciurus carolinensis]